jgi:hypothetical protein
MKLCLIFFIAVIAILCVWHVPAYKMIRYNGGGIYFWWQAGVNIYLKEKVLPSPLSIDADGEPLKYLGSSAGSLSAAMMAVNADFQHSAEFAIEQAERENLWEKKTGLFGIWGPLVREWLSVSLGPEEGMPANTDRTLYITATPIGLKKRTNLLYNLQNKEEILDACAASTHVPIFMNKRLYKKYQGKRYIDGSFWQFMTKGKTLTIIKTN